MSAEHYNKNPHNVKVGDLVTNERFKGFFFITSMIPNRDGVIEVNAVKLDTKTGLFSDKEKWYLLCELKPARLEIERLKAEIAIVVDAAGY